MTYEQYVKEIQRISVALIVALLGLLKPFQHLAMGTAQWLRMLAWIFPTVLRARYESARVARMYYDSERSRKTEELARHDLYLANYDPAWFRQAMEEVREDFSRENATQEALDRVISVAVKEMENAGRSTIRRGTQSDPRALGWARVEGGGESCGFCLMLISRGPVYKDQASAGGDGWKRFDPQLAQFVTSWHPNCDCKVVPVFSRSNWPGKDKYEAAERLWIEITKGYSGKEKLKAFRQHVEKTK